MNHVAAFVLRLAAGGAMQLMAHGREITRSRWPRALAFSAHRALCRAADAYEGT